MIEIKFSKNDGKDELLRINSRDIVGFYNCNVEQERKIIERMKYYGKTKSIKEIELSSIHLEEDTTVSQYLDRKVGSIINRDHVIEGFLELGELLDYKNELVSKLDISKQYCLEILVAFLQDVDIIILHKTYENAWDHTIEKILIEFSLKGAVIMFSEHGQASLLEFPLQSYDLNDKYVRG